MKLCSVLTIFVLLLSEALLAEPLRHELFGFEFGMSVEEAEKNGNERGYEVEIKKKVTIQVLKQHNKQKSSGR